MKSSNEPHITEAETEALRVVQVLSAEVNATLAFLEVPLVPAIAQLHASPLFT